MDPSAPGGRGPCRNTPRSATMPADMPQRLSRRRFAALSAAALLTPRLTRAAAPAPVLREVDYGAVRIDAELPRAQLANTHAVLMGLSEDSLLKPFRQMAGQNAPGEDLGGWYHYDPDFDWHRDDAGFAPGATFGQWVSALARYHAITQEPQVRAKVLRLNELYGRTIGGDFYDRNRFPAYCYDKLLLGLIDAHQHAADPQAFALLERTTAAALPHLPPGAIDRELPWRPGKDQSYRWDESYTNPENLFLAFKRGAGRRYRDLAVRFLDDATWFDPLARGEDVLADKHAYSYVNSLSSAMQAYLTLGSTRHLRAAQNAFALLLAQSYPSGGWGPDEKLVASGSDTLAHSLTATHYSFETPCGAYAHFKLTRYLLRVTRDARYGDSMERVLYNTVLGAKPLCADGRAFYYADYNQQGRKVYSEHRFPCCSGTLPQVATDYGINTYLRDAEGVYVNLYLPSRFSFRQGAARCVLQQSGDYPFGDTVTFELRASVPQPFALRLRIPAWASAARLSVNGRRWGEALEPGRFATLQRTWRDGDRIELTLPRALALEPLDARHTDIVALRSGPLVLFPVTSAAAALRPTARELLAARQVAPQRWAARIGEHDVDFLPYVALTEETYATCLTLAQTA